MKVSLLHGAGGEVMGELLQVLTRIEHNNAGGIGLEALDDGAVIPVDGINIVFTTDFHVVRPIFFTGGDIGWFISVCGTVNNLAMMGGRPIALSCGMIIEEGFEIDRTLPGLSPPWTRLSVKQVQTWSPAAQK